MNQHELIHAGLSVPPVGAAMAVYAGYLPYAAAAASIIWIAIQAFFFFKDRLTKKK